MEKPIGKRFTHVYSERGEPTSDSAKARFRVSKLVEKYFDGGYTGSYNRAHDWSDALKDLLEREIGINFGANHYSGGYGPYWSKYFGGITVKELLDSITVACKSGFTNDRRLYDGFIADVGRVFQEENLAFEIDAEGGIHPLIDIEFSRQHNAVINALSDEKYSATLAFITPIDAHLTETPPDYSKAIRSVFDANENLFKLMFKAQSLKAKTVSDNLEPCLQSLYSGKKTVTTASAKMVQSYKSWIDAAHNYRHAPGDTIPSQPTEEAAILMISQGLSYLRWLAQIDRERKS